MFLTSLRNASNGRYAHPSLIEIVGRDMADRTLRHSHHQTFTEWLTLNLSEQKADLDEYMRTTPAELAEVSYRELVPATAHDLERQLYLTDIEILLQLRSFEESGASPLPEASPRR